MHVGGWRVRVCLEISACEDAYVVSDQIFFILVRGQCPNAEPRRGFFIHLALAAGDRGLCNAKTCSSLTDRSMEHRTPFSTISFTHFLMGKNVTRAHFSLPDILDC